MHSVYAAFYSCEKGTDFIVKVGNSKQANKRIRTVMSPATLQDTFKDDSLTKEKAIETENEINEGLRSIFNSGGSGEFHLYDITKFTKVCKFVLSYFPNQVKHQPQASLVPVNCSALEFRVAKPTATELKKNYIR
jgi:hypothetical protein